MWAVFVCCVSLWVMDRLWWLWSSSWPMWWLPVEWGRWQLCPSYWRIRGTYRQWVLGNQSLDLRILVFSVAWTSWQHKWQWQVFRQLLLHPLAKGIISWHSVHPGFVQKPELLHSDLSYASHPSPLNCRCWVLCPSDEKVIKTLFKAKKGLCRWLSHWSCLCVMTCV